jgi:hypothetical protein
MREPLRTEYLRVSKYSAKLRWSQIPGQLARVNPEDLAKGHRLDSRQRESSSNQLLTAEFKLLRCPQSKKMRDHAHYFRVFCRGRENRGLLGWETVHTNPRAPIRRSGWLPLDWLS